jgi:hypothetical protein
MTHDQDWRRIRIGAVALRGAVATAIRDGEPVSVHLYGESQELPRGAEVAHFHSSSVVWIATSAGLCRCDVPHGWDGGSLAAIERLIDCAAPQTDTNKTPCTGNSVSSQTGGHR